MKSRPWVGGVLEPIGEQQPAPGVIEVFCLQQPISMKCCNPGDANPPPTPPAHYPSTHTTHTYTLPTCTRAGCWCPQERKAMAAQGLRIRRLSGAAITAQHWDTFYEFYLNTVEKRWGSAYLTRDFFTRWVGASGGAGHVEGRR